MWRETLWKDSTTILLFLLMQVSLCISRICITYVYSMLLCKPTRSYQQCLIYAININFLDPSNCVEGFLSKEQLRSIVVDISIATHTGPTGVSMCYAQLHFTCAGSINKILFAGKQTTALSTTRELYYFIHTVRSVHELCYSHDNPWPWRMWLVSIIIIVVAIIWASLTLA